MTYNDASKCRLGIGRDGIRFVQNDNFEGRVGIGRVILVCGLLFCRLVTVAGTTGTEK